MVALHCERLLALLHTGHTGSDLLFFAKTFRPFFAATFVIFLAVVSKLAVTVFASIYFQTF